MSGADSKDNLLEKCLVVLLDVAGTTTSISFVKETLFPFVIKQSEEFLKEKWEDEAIKEAVKTLKDDKELDLAAAVAAVKELTETNSDNKALKTIQGLIYKQGYENGDLKAHIFDDVPTALESWAKSRRVAIFSTGSVESQKLLFANTIHGDLSAHISKYLDQEIGSKLEKASYEKIAKDLEVKPEEIAFLSDCCDEAKAAKEAGLVAILVKREGNEPIPDDIKDFTIVTSFKDVIFEASGKRKIEEEAATEEPPTKVAKTEDEAVKKDEVKEAVENGDKIVEEKKEEEKVEKAEEAMEVDAATEAVEKPEEKTEPETKQTDSDKTTETDKTKTDDVKTDAEATKPTEETKMETSEVAPEESKIESKSETDKSEETKVEENVDVAKAETKEEEKKEIIEAEPVVEPVKEDKTVETPKTDEEKSKSTEETVEETPKPVEETPKSEEPTKIEETKSEEKPTEEKKETNGTASAEEKENKSELANGIENGKSDEQNGDNKQNGDSKCEETTDEIKVKKLEETTDTPAVAPPVSVEA